MKHVEVPKGNDEIGEIYAQLGEKGAKLSLNGAKRGEQFKTTNWSISWSTRNTQSPKNDETMKW